MQDFNFISQSKFETNLIGLIELASQQSRKENELTEKIEFLEKKLKDSSYLIEKLKKERTEEREMHSSKERRSNEEKIQCTSEVERLKVLNEELSTKTETLRSQNEQLQLSLLQKQQQEQNAHFQGHQSGERLSQLVSQDTLQQLNDIHEVVKLLEKKVATVSSLVTKAEVRALEMGHLLESSKDALGKSQKQLETAKASYREASLRCREDSMIISALRLDNENLQEQNKLLREEVASSNQTRRNLEAELEKTKLTVANSILAILEKEKIMQVSPKEENYVNHGYEAQVTRENDKKSLLSISCPEENIASTIPDRAIEKSDRTIKSSQKVLLLLDNPENE